MSRLTQVPPLPTLCLRLRGFHPLRPLFPECSADFLSYICWRSYNPGGGFATSPVWAGARSLATTCAIVGLLSLPPGTEMFQFPGFAPLARYQLLGADGLPHSEICGSRDICSSPQLIAAYHVLHRLREPRHPSCALFSFLYMNSWVSSLFKPGPSLFSENFPFCFRRRQ